MIIKYGGYAHQPGEATVTIDRHIERDENEVAIAEHQQWHIVGRLSGTDAADLTKKFNTLSAAYSYDYGDIGVYEDDGVTPTALFLLNRNTRYGVQVAMRPGFPEGGQMGAEYTTYIDYTIALQATLPVNNNIGLISSTDTLAITGNGGPEIIVREYLNGPPQIQQVKQQTKVLVSQTGEAKAYALYPDFPSLLYPQYLQVKRSTQRYIPPPRLAVFTLDPAKNIYRIAWNFYYELPQGVNGAGFRS